MTRTMLSSLTAAAILAMVAGGAAPVDAANLKQRNKAAATSGAKKKLKAETPSKGATWDQWRKALKDAGCALPRLCQ